MKSFFIKTYRFFEAKPVMLWVILFVITGLSIFSASKLRLVEDIGSFLPNNRDYKSINEAYQHLGGDNKLIVSIAMADTTTVRVVAGSSGSSSSPSSAGMSR